MLKKGKEVAIWSYAALGIKVLFEKKGSTKEYSVWLERRDHLGNLQAFLELGVSMSKRFLNS